MYSNSSRCHRVGRLWDGGSNALLEEYKGDKPTAYAHVCNQTYGSCPDETLLAIKRELEHRITLDVMEEHSWEQTDTGEWRKIENDEFWERFRAAMDSAKE